MDSEQKENPQGSTPFADAELDMSPIPRIGRVRYTKVVESFVAPAGSSILTESHEIINEIPPSHSNSANESCEEVASGSVLGPLNAPSTTSNLSESGYYGSWHRTKPPENYGSLACSMITSELVESQLQGTSTPRSRLVAEPVRRMEITECSDLTGAMVTTNPFESHLIDNVNSHTFSPSIFHKVVSPSSQDTPPANAEFRWSIDHMSVLQPADIDEFPMHQADVHLTNPEIEARIQSGLDSFWSQAHVAPSPMLEGANPPTNPAMARLMKTGPLGSAGSTASSTASRRFVKIRAPIVSSVSTQTMLTFPTDVDVMKLLGDFFSYNEETCSPSATCNEAANLSLNSLRRKLFSENTDTGNISLNESYVSKMDVSQARVSLSPELDDTECVFDASTSRVEDPLQRSSHLESPDISPIGSDNECL